MPRTRAVTYSVSFRLDENLFRQLAEKAARKGMSPGALARDLLRETLTDPLAERTLARLRQMEARLLDLQESLRHSTFTILVQLGCNEERAKRFVDEFMAVE